MATDQSFLEFLLDQLAGVEGVTARKMFGEYALYCRAKVVALVCDNQLFIKPTEAGRAYIGEIVEAPAYPGAKPSFLIEDKFEDRAWFCELVRITEQALPLAKPKIKKAKKSFRKPGRGCGYKPS